MFRKVVFRLLAVFVMAFAAAGSWAAETHEPVNHRFCFTCHGTDGIGSEGIQGPRLAGMEPWYLKRQLELFRAGGRGKHPSDIQGMEMQPMAAILTDENIADILEWAATWEYVPATPTLTGGDATRGRRLYQACASCHGDAAQGSEAMNAPALAGQNDWYLVTQLKNFKAGYRGVDPLDQYGAMMRTMTSGLADDKAIVDVVSYINTLGR
jgi:cytochrome c553